MLWDTVGATTAENRRKIGKITRRDREENDKAGVKFAKVEAEEGGGTQKSCLVVSIKKGQC